VNDETAARAWVSNNWSGANILSVAPVTRHGVTGFQVAFTITTLDGVSQSAAALVLNGAENKAHVATWRLLDVANVDLNSEVALSTYPDAVNALNSFTLLPNLAVADFTVTPVAPVVPQ
jgi:hypothetical protein